MLISEIICRAEDGPPIPEEIRTLARESAASRLTPEEARDICDRLLPHLKSGRRDDAFLMHYAQVFEMLRRKTKMLEFWNDVQILLPNDPKPLNFLMRWYRRERRVEHGAAHLSQLCTDAQHIPLRAQMKIVGLWELKLFSEADVFFAGLPANIQAEETVRFHYAVCLKKQDRLQEALKILSMLQDSKRAHNEIKRLLGLLHQKRRQMIDFGTDGSREDIFGKLVNALLPPEPPQRLSDKIGGIGFFTGQLGAGGAERQLTRIAIAMDHLAASGEDIEGGALMGSVRVYVKTLNTEHGKDHFLPILQDAGMSISVLGTSVLQDDAVLKKLPEKTRNLFSSLPMSMRENIVKLAEMFRKDEINVAYLWQDGGIYLGALSALLAGCPRIVAYFRGLPPNLRPHLMKPGMRGLYIALAKIPHVTFASNSAIAAREYESWLDMAPGTVIVIPNAFQENRAQISDEDIAFWDDAIRRTPECSKTVIGIFRFDQNKRPHLWIEAAAQYLQRHSDTRFVILGHGQQYEECLSHVEALGLQDRIILAGTRRNVEFFLEKADLLMHLAHMEGLPNAVIEAQICRVPVLATPAGGTTEIVEDGVTGKILPSAETVEIADVVGHLESLLCDMQTLRKMGETGQRIARERYSTPAVLEKTINLFRRG